MTKLELHELYIGNIVYIIIFLALVIFAFKRKMYNFRYAILHSYPLWCYNVINKYDAKHDKHRAR